MNETELISVVIPCYNRSHFVHETIASIQRQTHRDWEIIVVDDGAEEPETVASIEAVERQALPGVRVVREPHRGLPHARNRGLQLSRGRYVIPLDSDDLLEPEMMEVCLRAMRSHPEAGFTFFDYRVFGDIHDRYLSSGLKGWTQSPRCFVRDGSRRKTEAVAAIPWGGVTDAESPSPSY